MTLLAYTTFTHSTVSYVFTSYFLFRWTASPGPRILSTNLTEWPSISPNGPKGAGWWYFQGLYTHLLGLDLVKTISQIALKDFQKCEIIHRE